MQMKAFFPLPSCHLREANLTLQSRQQTRAPSPAAAVLSMPSSPTPTGGEEAAGERKEEQHLETGRPGTWERVRSPRSAWGRREQVEVGEPGCLGEDRATATPGDRASSEMKRGGGPDVVGQMGRGEGSCTQLGVQWRGAGWVGGGSRGRVRV